VAELYDLRGHAGWYHSRRQKTYDTYWCMINSTASWQICHFARCCWHFPSCPHSCCICTVHYEYCSVFNFIRNRWQRLTLLKGSLVHVTNDFMSTVSVVNISHVCVIILSFCSERTLCHIFYGGAHTYSASYVFNAWNVLSKTKAERDVAVYVH